MENAPQFQRPVVEYARTDFPLLREGMAAEGALTLIREHGIGERIVYFYVVDEEDRLVGVLPTRRAGARDQITGMRSVARLAR